MNINIDIAWTMKEKFDLCADFMTRLSEILSDRFELVGSCNNDETLYLIPKGTESELSYHGKPTNSFRFSDHWNWYASTLKCADENYIQCLSSDLPYAKKRLADGKASKPIVAYQIALIGEDDKYHCIYGEKFDRKTKRWSWVDANPEDVAKMVG